MNESSLWWPSFSQQLQFQSVPYTKDFEYSVHAVHHFYDIL